MPSNRTTGLPKRVTTPHSCERCGASFYPRIDGLASGKGRFCSLACYGASLHRQVDCLCQYCGRSFTVNPYRVKAGGAVYCSKDCRNHWESIPRVISDRFWSSVDRSKDCWEWTASVNKYGYGKASIGRGRSGAAHRFAFADTFGPIPDGLSVCHHCDNPRCVRPSHLFLGTTLVNNQDRSSKGRTASGDMNGQRVHPERTVRGERHHAAKLTWAQVRAIRARAATGEATKMLAAEFGVSVSQIGAIIRNRKWKT